MPHKSLQFRPQFIDYLSLLLLLRLPLNRKIIYIRLVLSLLPLILISQRILFTLLPVFIVLLVLPLLRLLLWLLAEFLGFEQKRFLLLF